MYVARWQLDNQIIETKRRGGVKGVGSGQDGYRDMTMYLNVMYQAVCYDADGIKVCWEEGGVLQWNLCASQRYPEGMYGCVWIA